MDEVGLFSVIDQKASCPAEGNSRMDGYPPLARPRAVCLFFF